jgi:pantetheine-phosphate adenylyltransferase
MYIALMVKSLLIASSSTLDANLMSDGSKYLLFGDFVIGVMHNPDKPSGMFSPAERADLVRQSVAHLGKKVCVETYGGLTVEAASKIQASFIIKSARTGGDFEVEQQMAQTNQGASGIETILLFSRPENSFISST